MRLLKILPGLWQWQVQINPFISKLVLDIFVCTDMLFPRRRIVAAARIN